MAGPVLTAVFRAARRAGKRARTQTSISANASSISWAAVALAKETVGDLADRDITVAGLGEMGQLALKTLYARGARNVRIVNRTVERAVALAEHVMAHTRTQINVHGLHELPEVLEATDVLIAVTGKEGWIIDANMAREAMKRRDGRELTIIDIAVPRNVEPATGDVGGVNVFDTDDIEAVKDSAVAARQQEIPKVEVIIAEEMRHLEDSLCKFELKPLITELRRKAEAIRQTELERTYRKLGSPDPKTWEHVQHLTRALVNKLYHHPTNIIKEKAADGRADVYAATIRELFGLSKTGGDGPDVS
jgi:glutamyl-tRNA reductase